MMLMLLLLMMMMTTTTVTTFSLLFYFVKNLRVIVQRRPQRTVSIVDTNVDFDE